MTTSPRRAILEIVAVIALVVAMCLWMCSCTTQDFRDSDDTYGPWNTKPETLP